jgi:hypothetical protein
MVTPLEGANLGTARTPPSHVQTNSYEHNLVQSYRVSRDGTGGGIMEWDVCGSVGLVEKSTQ